MTKPAEVQLAIDLLNKLHHRISAAKTFRLDKITMDLATAEQLADLLADSLRTIDQYQLVEFDHSVPVPPRRLNYDRGSN